MFLFCFGERKNFSVTLNRIGLKFEFHCAHANIFISRHPLSIINNIQIYLLTYLWPSVVNIDASVNKKIINGMQFQNYIYHLDALK
jgi:hypothetical protein